MSTPTDNPIGVTGTLLGAHQVLARIRNNLTSCPFGLPGVIVTADYRDARIFVGTQYGTDADRVGLMRAAEEVLHATLVIDNTPYWVADGPFRLRVIGEWAEIPIQVTTHVARKPAPTAVTA